MKSKIKQLTKIDFDYVHKITKLGADSNAVQYYAMELAKRYPNENQEQIAKRVEEIVKRDNIYNAAMEEIARCFETTIDPEELKQFTELLKKHNPRLQEPQVTNLARNMITKTLIYDIFKNDWKVDVTNEEMKPFLDRYAAQLKNEMIERKITDQIIAKFPNITIDEEEIAKQLEEAKERASEQHKQPEKN